MRTQTSESDPRTRPPLEFTAFSCSSSGVMSYLNGKLNTTEETASLLRRDANATDANLGALSDAAEQLQRTVRELQQRVSDIKNANIQGGKT